MVPAKGVEPETGFQDYPGAIRRALTQATELAICLAVIVPPFILGARQAYGQTVLAFLAIAACLLHATKLALSKPKKIPWRRPEVFLPLAALALSVLSYLPLPGTLVQIVSPGIRRLIPVWPLTAVSSSNRGWHYLSIAPGLSRESTFLFLLYAILFWVTLDTFKSTGSIRRFLTWLFWGGVGVAVLGLTHYLLFKDNLYDPWQVWWMRLDHHVRAPFTNRNHFAGYLALTIGAGIAHLVWLVRDRHKTEMHRRSSTVAAERTNSWSADARLLLAAIGNASILAAIVLSLSRAGILIGFLSAAIGSLTLAWAGLGRQKAWTLVAMIGIAVTAVVISMNTGDPFRRLSSLCAGNQSITQLSNGRLDLWKADLHALLDFPILGSGAGTHAYVYPLYFQQPNKLIYTHAENSYLQILVEYGLGGAALLTIAIFTLVGWCRGALRSRFLQNGHDLAIAATAISVALFAALLHGLVDFVWYVPAYAACVAVLAALAACLSRIVSIEDSLTDRDNAFDLNGSWPPKLNSSPAWLAAGLIVAALVGWHFTNQSWAEYAWNRYWRLLPTGMQADELTDTKFLVEKTRWLEQACALRPSEPDYWYRLGIAYQHQFQTIGQSKPISLLDLRTALQQCRAGNPQDAMAWLSNRFGADATLLEQAQACFYRSAEACPLQGHAYLKLAQFSRLDTPQVGQIPYLQQALRARPYDAGLYVRVGTECWVTGNLQETQHCWQRACHLCPDYQMKLLPVLASQMSASKVVSFLQPDFQGLKCLAEHQFKKGKLKEHKYLTIQAAQSLQSDSARSIDPDAWADLYELYREANQTSEAEECLRKALSLDPTRLISYIRLIHWCKDRGKEQEALELLRLVKQLFPGHPEVQVIECEIFHASKPILQGNT